MTLNVLAMKSLIQVHYLYDKCYAFKFHLSIAILHINILQLIYQILDFKIIKNAVLIFVNIILILSRLETKIPYTSQ